MSDPDRIPAAELPRGAVRRVGEWAVGNADGCLVCPWHQSRYDVGTGEMVEGPRDFLGYHGPTPGYTQFVRTYAQWLRLRVRRAVRRGPDVVVE